MGDTEAIFFPDDTIPVIGYRAFIFKSMVAGEEEFYGIRAVAKPVFWNTEGPTRAKCHSPMSGLWKGEGCQGPYPNARCECGLYAHHSSRFLSSFLSDRICACVVGWGQMYRHGSEGWRAEYAKPVAFVRPRVEQGLLGTSAIEGVERIAAELGARIFEGVAEMDHWARTCGRFSSWWTSEDERRANGQMKRQLPKPKAKPGES